MSNKKTILQILIVCLGASFTTLSCSSKAYLFTSFREPATDGLRLLYSYDGYTWTDFNKVFLKPEIGLQKVMRDPSIVQDRQGTFHLVWTSSWRGDKGFGYANTKDFQQWSAQRFIPVMKHEPTTVNVWAPELFFDDHTDSIIIIWASTIPGRFERGIEEDSNNHRMYFTTTTDFHHFSPTRLFLDPGFSVIDAVIVKKAEDDYVLVLKDNTRPNRNLKVASARKPLENFEGVSDAFTESLTEGPSVVKIRDEWLIYFDSYGKKSYEVVKTKDFRSFTNATTEVSIPEGHKHGTIVPVKKKLVKKILHGAE